MARAPLGRSAQTTKKEKKRRLDGMCSSPLQMRAEKQDRGSEAPLFTETSPEFAALRTVCCEVGPDKADIKESSIMTRWRGLLTLQDEQRRLPLFAETIAAFAMLWIVLRGRSRQIKHKENLSIMSRWHVLLTFAGQTVPPLSAAARTLGRRPVHWRACFPRTGDCYPLPMHKHCLQTCHQGCWGQHRCRRYRRTRQCPR